MARALLLGAIKSFCVFATALRLTSVKDSGVGGYRAGPFDGMGRQAPRFGRSFLIGQRLDTVLTKIVCGETGLLPENVIYERSNTWDAPDSGTTSGSRQTLFIGEVCCRACKELRAALKTKAAAGNKEPLGLLSREKQRSGGIHVRELRSICF